MLWLSDDFTLYGGIGATFHIMKCDGLVESTSYYRNGRTRRYTYQLKTVTYETEAATDTQYWFVGARWRIQDHFFVFGEYRKTRGKFELTTDDLDYYNKLRSFEQDMDASCVMIGVGWLF